MLRRSSWLVKVGHADLLTSLSDELVIPADTAEELLRGDEHDRSVQWIQNEGRGFIVEGVSPAPEVSAWDLGMGESAVLSWAHEHSGYEVILDDRAARNCAIALGIPVRGTLGVLLLAKEAGLIDRVGPVIRDLIASGLHVHDSLRADVSRLAGESP